MKRISALIMMLCALSMSGCGKKTEPVKARFTVVASFYPVYIIAKNAARDVPGVEIVNLTPPVTGCLHDYSVTANDMKKLESADLLLVNGAGMESFMSSVLSRFPSLPSASLSKGIRTLKDEHGENAHIWVSLSLYSLMVENCVEALSSKDPVYRNQYRAAGDVYMAKVKTLKTGLDKNLNLLKGKKIITFHEAFPYFAADYGLEIAAVIEREPGSEPSAKEIASTIDLVRKSSIKTLFAEPQYPLSSAEVISRATGAKVFILDPAVTGPDEYDAYLSIMKKNGEVLAEALQ